MPLQNRVTPLGDIVAVADRGLVYGNRGCLHDEHGRIRRRYGGQALDRMPAPLSRPAPLAALLARKFTELFFLDEATAFAAGHRPWALCRRGDYRRFLTICGAGGVDEIDATLHTERLGERRRTTLSPLPDGAFVLRDGDPLLVLGDSLRRWTTAGYTERIARPGSAELVTPPSLVEVLHAGWRGDVPLVHPSAHA
jgi:hypothetical protein